MIAFIDVKRDFYWVRRGPWRRFEAVEYATLEWVEWFNHRRPLEPIGNMPLAETEELNCAAADNIDMAA